MANNKKLFRMIETDENEIEQKLRAHRLKLLKRVLIVAGILLIAVIGIYIFFQMKTFTNYEATSTIERSDTAAAKFEDFGGKILKYSNDGAFYTDLSDNMIWNQTYEMQNPVVDICGNYAAIADKGGTQIYVMDKAGMQGNIKTTMPIFQVSVAAQGTVAVLLQQDGASYLQMYDKTGTVLVSGELHQENSGYPLSIALASDAKKMAISMMNISDGTLKTTIAFYNFGSVGQNEIDNIVATYSYSDKVFPEMKFVTNNKMVAFGDDSILIYEGTQKPKLSETIKMSAEVKSIFYNNDYFGVVYNNEDENNTRHMEIYDMKGSEVLSKDFDMDYDNIEFLDNNEICITNNTECKIYSLYGVERFEYTFDTKLSKVLSGRTQINYTFILDGTTEKVKLK